jgi:predicted permease
MRDWRPEIERRLPPSVLAAIREGDVVRELAEHLDDRFDELRAAGVADDEATRLVLEELDDPAPLVRELQLMGATRPLPPPPLGVEARGWGGTDVWQDVRYGGRMLRKTPLVTFVAALTLALGLGANAAIFTLINTVVLQPLPYAAPDELVRIYESNASRGWPTFAVSQPNFLDWVANVRAFDQLAATGSTALTLTDNGESERVVAQTVTHSFLPVLGVTPHHGRNFTAEEDRPGGNTRVAILTFPYWQRRFGGDSGVLGRVLTLNNQSYTVVGILPETFNWGRTLELLVPLAPSPSAARTDHRLSVIGRMKRGIAIEQARADLAAIANSLAVQYPESNEGWSVNLLSFRDWLVPVETRRALAILAVAVIAVLLIACSNVASLLLARATARHKEISVRLALGARRGRVARQLLVEAVLLSLVAGAAGLLIAYGATAALRTLGPDTLPRLDEAAVDTRVVLFGLVLAIVTGVLFGLAPALTAMRSDVSETLKEGGRSGGAVPARQRLRGALVMCEIALSVMLLVGAAMLLRSFWQVLRVDPGFNTSQLLTMQISVPRGRFESGAHAWAFYERLLGELGRLPGVQSAALTSAVPMSPGNTAGGIRIPGRPATPDGNEGSADWRIVSPGYFKTMGIKLRGREFTSADTDDTRLVAIVSESFAERYWPGEDAIGKSVILSSAGEDARTVVGVAGDVRSFGLDATADPMAYFPTPAAAGWNPMSVVLRTTAEPTAMAASARGVLRSIDPTIPFYNVTTADALLAASMGPRRFMMVLIAVFAAVALVLAAVGLFGVMVYLVSQRGREIGIRIALGARPAHVFRSVIGRGLALAAAGAAAGVGGALWLAPLLESFLFEVNTLDLPALVSAPAMLVLVAALASYLPARRAMRVDPLSVLREE